MKPTIEIAGRRVGADEPTFVVAELSANHLQRYELAARTIEAAKAAGADAVKLQTYTPDSLTIDSDSEPFRIAQGTPWDGRTFYDLYKGAYMPMEWHEPLFALARDLGLIAFSAPTDVATADFLDQFDMPAMKIASFEITDIAFVRHVAAKGKPVILSTGIARLADIEEALEACRSVGNEAVAVLKCTSAYPAPPEDQNLRVIPLLESVFGTVVGLSDHTQGIAVAAAAVALGARIVEKHLILERSLGGPDAAFSLEPDEFKTMVGAVREAEDALGDGAYVLTERQRTSRQFARSLFVVEDVKSGDLFSADNVRSIRPGYGLHPRYRDDVIGRRATRDIPKGTPLSWDLVG